MLSLSTMANAHSILSARPTAHVVRELACRLNKHKTLLVSGFATVIVVRRLRNTSYFATVVSHVTHWINEATVAFNSLLVMWCSRRYENRLREVFRNENVRTPDKRAVTQNHSHGVAACSRSFASEFIDRVTTRSGFDVYSVSMSRRDQLAGQEGNKYFYWAKDLQCPYANSQVPQNHVAKLIDVDYYVDLPGLLRSYDNIMAYTFNPTAPGGGLPNGTYSITDDIVTCRVNGGAEYQHPLYYYDVDHFYVRTWYGGKLFLVETKECPNIDGKPTDYKIVCMVLKAKLYGPLAWLYSQHAPQRRKFTYGSFNATRSNELINGQWQVVKHYSPVGSSTSVSIPERLVEAAYIRCARSKAPAISDVERLFREGNQVNDPVLAASLFISIFSQQPELLLAKPMLVTKYIGSNYSYQSVYPLITEDGKPTMRELPVELYPSAYHPVRSLNNDEDCIEKRLFSVEATKVKIPPFFTTCITEFIDLLLTPTPGGKAIKWSLAPVDLDCVREKQDRPTQRSLLDRAIYWLHHGSKTVTAFQKAEAYDSINAPRNISNTSVDPKTRLAAFIYPFTEAIKQHHFYAFGHHPTEFSNRLYAKSLNKTTCICTDYSKFDGTHSLPLHEFEVALVLKAFPPEYHAEITELMRAEVGAMCHTKNGVSYLNGYSRLSGSMNTSVMNTLDNALISYVTYRTMGHPPLNAYRQLGMYGGDDGVNFDIDPKAIERVANKFGLSIKAEVVKAHEPVYFLARCFPDLWTSPQSFCDVKRQISKLHLTATSSIVPLEIVLHRKLSSYLVTDPTTPIISDYAKTVLNYLPQGLIKNTTYDEYIRDFQWWSQYESPFIVPEADNQLMLTIVLTSLQMDYSDYVNWKERLHKCKSLDDVLKCQLLKPKPPVVKTTAAHNDQVVGLDLPKPMGPKPGGTMAKVGKENNKRARKTLSRQPATQPVNHAPKVAKATKAAVKTASKPAKGKVGKP